MILLDEELMVEARLNEKLIQHNFFESHCRRCMGTELQRKRDCSLLHGYRTPCCDIMDKKIEQGNKETNKKMLSKALVVTYASYNRAKTVE